ncbi:MAG: transglutaminase domain-containing protein [Chloroflexi bacterium]|nr:transglutaminase domain-containing protein [Chloroflexota bacterium]
MKSLLPRLEEGWFSPLLLIVIVETATLSVVAASWVDGLSVLPWLAVISISWGLLFAKLPLPGAILHPVGLAAGIGVTTYLVTSTLPGESFAKRLDELITRLLKWTDVVLAGGIGNDNLLFLLALGALTWLIGYLGAWTVFHSHSGWWISLAAGTALVINTSYAPHLADYFLVFMVCSILLVARLNVYRREATWRRSGVHRRGDLGWTLTRMSLVITVLVAAVAWLTPTTLLASQPVSEALSQAGTPWNDVQDAFNRLFGGVGPTDRSSTSGFGKTLTLKTGVALGGDIVLQVSGTDPRRLRGVVYEKYTGMGWTAAERSAYRISGDAGQPTLAPEYAMRMAITRTITVVEPRGNIVFAPSVPKRIGVSGMAEMELPDDLGDMDYADVSVVRSSSMLRKGFRYTVESSVSVADVKSLREAGNAYPGWLEERYLSLPRTIPRRTLMLGAQIADRYNNGYDKALAIETYLRGLTYSEQVNLPPSVRDAVDYFLFVGREGYCDYFASAFVVLARSRGIPSRVVSGYAPGEPDLARGLTVVRDSHAHSWPEVYFPEFGWIEFEPTPSRPIVARPETPPMQLSIADGIEFDEEDDGENAGLWEEPPDVDWTFADPLFRSGPDDVLGLLSRVLAALLFLAALAGAALLFLWRRDLGSLMPGTVQFVKMCRLASWFGIGKRSHQTPDEYALTLSGIVPDQKHNIWLITEAYVRQVFGRKPIARRDERQLAIAWRQLRGGLVRAKMFRR